jgi:hypothetical protein
MPSRSHVYSRLRTSIKSLLLALVVSGCAPSPEAQEKTAATAVASAFAVLEAWLNQAAPTDYTFRTVSAMKANFEQAMSRLDRKPPELSEVAVAEDALGDALVGLKEADVAMVKTAAHKLARVLRLPAARP